MVRVDHVFGILAGTLAGVSPALASPANFPPFNIDLTDWWMKQVFACPLWKGTPPIGAHPGTCYKAFTRTSTKGSTTARLYQVPGTWQSADRYREIANGVWDAIQKGLDIFGTFPSGDLTINIGILNGMLGDRAQTDADNGIKGPCYILVDFPAEWNEVPLRAIQKDVIQNMYYCVEQFAHPSMGAFKDGDEWWRQGVARYFDGLAYPGDNSLLEEGLYPEEYHYPLALYQNADAAALFFHFADGLGGWSPRDVHDWMKGHASAATYDTERAAVSADPKLVGLWHKFCLAFTDNKITYPSTGAKIGNKFGGLPKTAYSTVSLAVDGTYSKTFGVDAWEAKRLVFPIKAGQMMRVSAELDTGLEWSIRKEGTAAWNSGARGRTVTVAAAAGANTNYEIVVSSSRNDAGGFYGKIKMRREP